MVIGDRRPFLVALVTLDPEEAAKLREGERATRGPRRARGRPGDPGLDRGARRRDQPQKFARVEQVKKVAILPRDLSQEGGELTPTMKVKRNVVAEKYAGEVDALYER